MNNVANSASAATPQKGEWRVAAVLVVVMLILEAFMRWWMHSSDSRVQSDNNNVRSLARTAREMRAYPGCKVLLVGNSLTRDGVEPSTMRAALERAGRDHPQVFPCRPSGTSAPTWDYALHRYFLRTGDLPDEIFIFTGPGHLNDAMEDTARLRNFFVHPDDLSRAWSWDVGSSEERLRFIFAQVSRLSGVEMTLKLQLFDRFIPRYTDMEQLTNRARWQHIRTVAAPHEASYRHLTLLLDELRDRHILTHVVVMPVIYQAAPLDPAAAKLIAEHAVDLIDLSKIPELNASHFSDGYHLNRSGAHILSAHLADEIIARFR